MPLSPQALVSTDCASAIDKNIGQPFPTTAPHAVRQGGGQFLSKNLTPEQIHEMAAKEDPLKTFGAACRAKLHTTDVDR